MSFLGDDGDQQATLEVALAFIDACDAGEGAAHASSTDSSSGDEFWTEREDDDPTSLRVVIRKAPSALAQPPPPQPPTSWVHPKPLVPSAPSPGTVSSQDTAARAAAPVAKPTSASTRATSLKKHRDRKKAEMQSLREQVAALEAQLAGLRVPNTRPRLGDTGETPLAVLPFLLDARSQLLQAAATGTSWVDIAGAQASERFRAEALNRKLRDALQRQSQVSEALRGVLGCGETLSAELKLLLGLHKNQSLHSPRAAPETVLLQQLHANLQQMYSTVDSVIGPQCAADWSGAASCTTREKDGGGRKRVEIRSTSQLFCGFAEIGRVMWRRTLAMQSSKYMIEKRLVTGSSYMKTYRMPLETPSKDAHPVDLHGTSYMHKFDEPGRHLCLWTSVVALPEVGAEFLEQGWILATPSLKPAGPAAAGPEPPSTVLKVCYEVSCASEGLAAPSAQSRALADAVLTTLGRRTRAYVQTVQNTLLDEYSPFQRHLRPPLSGAP